LLGWEYARVVMGDFSSCKIQDFKVSNNDGLIHCFDWVL
jgi:hypothetical protein